MSTVPVARQKDVSPRGEFVIRADIVESESVGEVVTTEETEPEPNPGISEHDHFNLNLRALEANLNEFIFDRLRPSLAVHPTASDMQHVYMHPNLYRNLKRISNLDLFAEMLGVGSEWVNSYQNAINENNVRYCLRSLKNLPDTCLESEVEIAFALLVSSIRATLYVDVETRSQKKVILGGLLARNEIDFKSKVDNYFIDGQKNMVHLATEAK